jgi:hypothetical protein
MSPAHRGGRKRYPILGVSDDPVWVAVLGVIIKIERVTS